MKIGVISDIHGNYEALKSVLKELDRLGVSEIYSLGDVVGYYSQVNECCEELIERNIPSLMGNHDWYLASGGFCPRSRYVNDCLEYQRKVITDKNIEWLRSSAIQRFVGNIHMVHGGWTDPIDEYLKEPNEEYFSKIEGKIFMSGHTHIQVLKQYGEKTYCNPGSVGQPRDRNPKAAFAIVENDNISLHRVDYDIDKVNELMIKAGFNDANYKSLKKEEKYYAGFHKTK
ncbi:metallophosphoesterase family protein [Arenibacter palladensis]|uniref:metallophosphoesterase family protein n=1 Tax=Arenibacter palladensis TaxID=237373 RepID=UPI0026E46303|nr:YfcE family phosphodiesterase [Arenibacter palladensis]MDO6605130.1 YfcE family phosphodiesterase [Arenibacter palladensis]